VLGARVYVWAQAAAANPNPNQQGAQILIGGQQQAVGGISIRADGLIENAGRDAEGKLRKLWTEAVKNTPVDFQAAAPLRKVSLRGLETAVRQSLDARKPLAEEFLVLGGLQQVRYVLAYPEQKDIVLVGPAEGWKVDARGNVVGATTGRPVMLLDDLLVALRTAATTARGGITCSIDPTAEGMQQVRGYVAKLHTIGSDPEATARNIEQALGRQQISFTGVPPTSHFAGVLLAADYRMKRLAMNFEPSPVRGLPSFLSMLSGTGHGMSNLMQRWWLEPKYESVLRDASGLAWELDGGSVRCKTEEEFLDAGGSRQAQGKASPLAQKWADLMTQHYGELAVAEPVFGELRNCVDLAVVGAIVARIRFQEPEACNLPLLLDASVVKTAELPVATQVDSKTSMLKKGHNWILSASGGVAIQSWWILSASGGVAIQSWSLVEKARTADAPASARAKSVPVAGAKWSWN
ncbi:MAG: DUF1598 domain-containing protein, partial [Thermoguttaceae bacterium]